MVFIQSSNLSNALDFYWILINNFRKFKNHNINVLFLLGVTLTKYSKVLNYTGKKIAANSKYYTVCQELLQCILVVLEYA